MSGDLLVDARGKRPPEPMEMTLEALDFLAPGAELVLLIHREPGPLYSVLVQNGFSYRTERDPDGNFRVRIRHAPE